MSVVADSASDQVDEILAFWFGDARTGTSYDRRRKLWFSKNLETDRLISDRFCSVYNRAITGKFEAWQQFPQGCLALLLLFDQFPRHMFRGTPQAFAADPIALEIAQSAIDRGFDQALPPIQRIFVYIPLEHSENLEHQRRSVSLFAQLKALDAEFADVYDYAQRHQRVIERFGRFPHRNAILDRANAPEETEFLQQPGSSF